MDYKEVCEKLYSKWTEDENAFSDIKGFDTEFLIEPYCRLQNGNNPLYVLNNNPGKGLEIQSRSGELGSIKNTTYSELSKQCVEKIVSKLLKGKALERVSKMTEFAEKLGFEGLEETESFFLHSERFNKHSFLKKNENQTIKEYTQALTEYLKDKPVLSINAVSTKESISKNSIQKSEWLEHIAKIISFDFDKAKEIKLTKKDEKITSAAYIYDKKIMIFMMGSNNLPKISEDKYKEIQNALK